MSDARYVPTRDPIPHDEYVAFAHAVDPALEALEVVAHKPIQGEAMHKVIGFYAAQALVQVGWLGPYGLIPGGMDNDPVPHWKPVYIVRDPRPDVGSVARVGASDRPFDLSMEVTRDQ